MNSFGWRRVIVVIALAGFVAVLAPAGVAIGAEVTNPPTTECNPDGRAFCTDVTTFAGITASDDDKADGDRYTWVEWKVRNTAVSTLTNPAVQVRFEDYDCSAEPAPQDGPPTGCAALAQTSHVVSSLPAGCTSATGATVTCTYPNIAGGGNTGAPTRIYFKTADEPATHSRITVRTTVKERGNDAGSDPAGCSAGDPNCDTYETFVDNSYEPDPDAAYTFALTGHRFLLETDDTLGLGADGASSFTFRSGSAATFRAAFSTDFPAACGTAPSPTCFGRTLEVATVGASSSTYNQGPLVFYARLTSVPSGLNANNVVAIHTYDDNSTATIGDQASERSSKGCTTTYSSQIPVPSICAKKVQGMQQALDVWVWDNRNGQIKFG